MQVQAAPGLEAASVPWGSQGSKWVRFILLRLPSQGQVSKGVGGLKSGLCGPPPPGRKHRGGSGQQWSSLEGTARGSEHSFTWMGKGLGCRAGGVLPLASQSPMCKGPCSKCHVSLSKYKIWAILLRITLIPCLVKWLLTRSSSTTFFFVHLSFRNLKGVCSCSP